MSDDDPYLRRESDNYEESYPARNLWVHPGIEARYGAETVCDIDAIRAAAEDDDISKHDGAIAFVCPGSSCDFEVALDRELKYLDLKNAGGVMRCPRCEMGWFAHKWPPDPIDPNGGGGP